MMHARCFHCLQDVGSRIVLFQFAVMDCQGDPVTIFAHGEDMFSHQGITLFVGMVLGE